MKERSRRTGTPGKNIEDLNRKAKAGRAGPVLVDHSTTAAKPTSQTVRRGILYTAARPQPPPVNAPPPLDMGAPVATL